MDSGGEVTVIDHLVIGNSGIMHFNIKLILISSILFLSLLGFVNHAQAVTEFTTVVDPGNGAGTDFTKLSDWQSKIHGDIVNTYKVMGGTKSGTMADVGVLYLCRWDGGSWVKQGTYASSVWTTSTQILLNLTDFAVTPLSGDMWNTSAGCGGSDYFTTNTDPDSVTVTAKCRATIGAGGTAPPDTSQAITISNWTLDATHTIKIWTDPTEGYRHRGTYSTTAYRIESSYAADLIVIGLNTNFITIDGLQIYQKNTSGNNGFLFGYQLTSAQINLTNNLIRGPGSSGTGEAGIFVNASGSATVNINNNIFYDWAVSTGWSSGLYFFGGTFTYNIYNNTFYNNRSAIRRSNGTVIAKNNIAQATTEATNAYFGSFDATSSNNISDKSDDGANATQGTVNFVNSGTGDFHLASNDSVALNNGTSLAGSFTNDIDGQARSGGGAWDIGADERITANVFLSVGQTAGDLKNGSPTITISSSLTTLSVGQTGNIGVGDLITYNTTSKVYIVSKGVDNTKWNVQTLTGGIPPDVSAGQTVNSITHTYTSLNSAIAGASGATVLNTTDLVTNNYILNFPCYYDSGADTTAANITGYTTGASNYLRVYTPSSTTTEANASQRHQGKWDDTKYNLDVASVNSSSSLAINLPYVRIDGLQVGDAPTNGAVYANGIGVGDVVMTTMEVQISNNIVRKTGGNYAQYANGIVVATGNLTKIWNNIIYDSWGTVDSRGILGSAATVQAFNNTVYHTGYAYLIVSNGSILAKNNIAQDTNNQGYAGGGGGTFDGDSTNNLSDRADSPGSNPQDSKTVSFIDATNKDFHLSSYDTAAKNLGVDLSSSFTTDIDGQARPGSKWDIGADEFNQVAIIMKKGTLFNKGVLFK